MNIDKRNEIFLKNQNLIHSVINKHFMHSKTLSYDDMYQIGSIALIKAIDNFNKELNINFSTYAYKTIWGTIMQEFSKNDCVTYSRRIVEISNKLISKNIDNIDEMLNKIDDLSEFDKLAIKSRILGLDSLDRNIQTDKDDICLSDVIPSNININENYILLKESLKNILNEKELKILNMLYSGYVQREIASELNIRQPQISRIIKNIQAKIINMYVEGNEVEKANNLFKKYFITSKDNYNSVNYIINKYKLKLNADDIIYLTHKTLDNKSALIKQKKEDIKMQNNEWSKKQINTLITKSLIKIILSDQKIPEDNNLKPLIIDSLNKNGIININLNDKILDISKNQILSFYMYAKNLIKKYNYTYPEQINLNSYEYDIIESVDDGIKLKDEDSLSNKLLNIINKIIINNNSSKISI